MFYLSEESVLSSWYNLFQRVRWEIDFKKFSKFSTLFDSVKNKSNRSEKILFIWLKSVTLPSWQFCFKEACTRRRTSLLLFWSKRTPRVKLEHMSAFMCFLCVHRKKTSYDHKVWFSLHNIKPKEYCLFNVASYF